ncbi:D-alanyl-D-alanine carboxypeptidase [Epibacterium sp. SM1979]|uniref:D-alanyl-D-alanine carboxypeptidase n=1 Tax=Tritonibacter litoralis TaxID=2662264 RepID=A0A843YHE2_9RHOB|nr:D-alanyl-D-alanine carboxypeptidase family protein [Tritonibacter litoralis]MQQ08702.1 D-alanyl-D-alanine carboxypeptidase [Tritonibacter litoralis]
MAKIAQVPLGRNPVSRWYNVGIAIEKGRGLTLWVLSLFLLLVWSLSSAQAAPYAALVMDGRTGEVLHTRNADTRLHPASLTKMMTLYIAFEAVRNGEITLDTKVKISRNAAAEPPSKLGLKSGQRIALRYLIRAAAIKSGNDAATAIGEAISGSEAAFARRMNRTAKALGMTRTTFKNAHGLTAKGHLSTARDMTTLGRHILYDYPEYYNLFSRTSADAGVRTVANTNRRLLAAYKGADGIKTGYTNAAGFNLVASAKRGNKRVIATVFGGKSSTSRNAKVAELLDLGFRRASKHAKLRKPTLPPYRGNQGIRVASGEEKGAAGKTIRVTGLVNTSLRPKPRPSSTEPEQVLVATNAPASTGSAFSLLATNSSAPLQSPELQASIQEALTEASVSAPPQADTGREAEDAQVIAAVASAQQQRLSLVQPYRGGVRPQARPARFIDVDGQSDEPIVVTRLSTSGGRYWGINVGRYGNRFKAEKVLLKTALTEMSTLNGSLRKVVKSPRGFDANFLGMTQENAELACRRLQARNTPCETIGPRS